MENDENGVYTNPRITASAVRAFLYEEDERKSLMLKQK